MPYSFLSSLFDSCLKHYLSKPLSLHIGANEHRNFYCLFTGEAFYDISIPNWLFLVERDNDQISWHFKSIKSPPRYPGWDSLNIWIAEKPQVQILLIRVHHYIPDQFF